jgi:hypothetical protein
VSRPARGKARFTGSALLDPDRCTGAGPAADRPRSRIALVGSASAVWGRGFVPRTQRAGRERAAPVAESSPRGRPGASAERVGLPGPRRTHLALSRRDVDGVEPVPGRVSRPVPTRSIHSAVTTGSNGPNALARSPEWYGYGLKEDVRVVGRADQHRDGGDVGDAVGRDRPSRCFRKHIPPSPRAVNVDSDRGWHSFVTPQVALQLRDGCLQRLISKERR